MVGQNTFLLDDTIANNIKFFSEEENIQLKECLEIVDFYDHVKKLESGFETVTGERVQNFQVAKGKELLLQDPYLETQKYLFWWGDKCNWWKKWKIIFNNLFERFSKNLHSSCTQVSMLKNFDRIIIMDQGQIIKDGNYNEIF